MAHDAATGTVVLFGGVDSDETGVTEDTWTWGSAFTRLPRGAPR
jgi:hypothetical protein